MPQVSQWQNKNIKVGAATAMMRVSPFLRILREYVAKQLNFTKTEQELSCSTYASQPFFKKGFEWVSQFQLSSRYNTIQISKQEYFNKKHGSGSESNSSKGGEHQHNCVRLRATAYETRNKETQMHKESNKYQHF